MNEAPSILEQGILKIIEAHTLRGTSINPGWRNALAAEIASYVKDLLG